MQTKKLLSGVGFEHKTFYTLGKRTNHSAKKTADCVVCCESIQLFCMQNLSTQKPNMWVTPFQQFLGNYRFRRVLLLMGGEKSTV